jgi:hypothetical protein
VPPAKPLWELQIQHYRTLELGISVQMNFRALELGISIQTQHFLTLELGISIQAIHLYRTSQYAVSIMQRVDFAQGNNQYLL